MREAADWVERYRGFWEGQLDALSRYLEGEQPDVHRRGTRERAGDEDGPMQDPTGRGRAASPQPRKEEIDS